MTLSLAGAGAVACPSHCKPERRLGPNALAFSCVHAILFPQMSETAGNVLNDELCEDAIMVPGSPGSAGTDSVVLENGGGGGGSSLRMEEVERESSRYRKLDERRRRAGQLEEASRREGQQEKEGRTGGKVGRPTLLEFGGEGGDSLGGNVCVCAANVVFRYWNRQPERSVNFDLQTSTLAFCDDMFGYGFFSYFYNYIFCTFYPAASVIASLIAFYPPPRPIVSYSACLRFLTDGTSSTLASRMEELEGTAP